MNRYKPKECKICGNLIPPHVTINGKVHKFYGRVYCLNCVPFGTHNIKNRPKIEEAVDITCKCPYCNKEFGKYGIRAHIWRVHGEGRNHRPRKPYYAPWNKGLSKKTDERVAASARKDSLSNGGKNSYYFGKHLGDTTKRKISTGMKKAHEEGRAWNIGINHWDGKPSYPEQFFIKVIGNDFHDKNYSFNYVVGRFRIDFAWVDKRLAIEIDGGQHEREDNKKRDLRKDKYLRSLGWKILRIKWRDMFHNSSLYIQIAIDFVEGKEANEEAKYPSRPTIIERK